MKNYKTLRQIEREIEQLSGFLYARPSFVEGIGRIFDLGGTLQEYNLDYDPQELDALAIESDWRVVGLELGKAMGKTDKNLKNLSQAKNDGRRKVSRS